MKQSPRPAGWYRFVKRVLDFALAGTALVLLSPVLGFIAFLVRISSPGPTLFKQKRLGLNGTIFTIFKFRTMVVHEARSLNDKLVHKADPRITPIGKFLRDFRLDELPQLINVVRGEMSLVGPRPLAPEFLPYYSEKDKQRMKLRPGVTGWQQVNGAANHSWTERISLDVWYVENANLWLDVQIIWRTIGVALKREGVYASDGSQLSGIPDAFLATLAKEPQNECSRNSPACR